jgi:CheY-like chemotaxis protein
MDHQSRPRVLLATRKGASKVLSWADVATSGAQALTAWREKRHGYVYADFGDLGDGMTGARLSSAIRKESADTVIILLVDSVQPHHRQWAERNGATDAIERSSKAILESLPGAMVAPRASEFPSTFLPSAFHSEDASQAVSRVVDEALKKYGRMGPARSLVLRDALNHFLGQGTIPSVVELAKRVARDIPNTDDRTQFLKSFDTTK